MGLPSSEAHDLSSEVIFLAIARIDRFDENKGDVEAWLTGIARKVALAYRRQNLAHRDRFVPLNDDLAVTPNPEQDLQVVFKGAIEGFSEPDRSILYLRFHEDLPTKEIAAQLTINHDLVRQRLARALEKMRRDPSLRQMLLA
ncbi:MAG: sigma-70 family RNA polymerase sigma factor [Armatimonadetes bacterium]|nr:sigma-70 family RNA polymerase sigma factor [Armatimonadota bacterium]